MSAVLDKVLDAERLADCKAHDDVPRTDLQRALNAISRAPLATVSDCLALLTACANRIEAFDRAHAELDLHKALDALADAEGALEEAPVSSPAEMAAARASCDREDLHEEGIRERASLRGGAYAAAVEATR